MLLYPVLKLCQDKPPEEFLDGIPGQTQYVKESGSGLTTGWVAK